jgi:predicted nuclease of predicted toxin-antitoxin system
VPEPVRFHLDEHMPHAIAEALARKSIDVTTTAGAGMLGAHDTEQIAFGKRQRRVVVTDDTDFLRLAVSIPDHSGIAFCRRLTLTIGQIIEGLALIHAVMSAEEMVGHVEYL